MRSAIIENGVVVNIINGELPGSVECGPEVGKGWTYDGQAFTPPPEPSVADPTGDDVEEERERRIRAGRVFTTTGGKKVHVTGRPVDRENLQGLAFSAQLLIGQGVGETSTPFRDGQNVIHDLTQHELLDLWAQAATYVSDCFKAQWSLKDDPDGIPADFKDDKYWK